MSNSNKNSRGAHSLALPRMPDQTVTVLSYCAGALFVTYLAMVIVTISFATTQTGLAASVRSTEGSITQLETTYYASLTKESSATPASVGLVTPASVEYAVSKPAQGISFAGK